MVHLCCFSSSHAVQAIRQRRPIGAGQQVVGRGRQERQEEARVTEKEGNTGEEGLVMSLLYMDSCLVEQARRCSARHGTDNGCCACRRAFHLLAGYMSVCLAWRMGLFFEGEFGIGEVGRLVGGFLHIQFRSCHGKCDLI